MRRAATAVTVDAAVLRHAVPIGASCAKRSRVALFALCGVASATGAAVCQRALFNDQRRGGPPEAGSHVDVLKRRALNARAVSGAFTARVRLRVVEELCRAHAVARPFGVDLLGDGASRTALACGRGRHAHFVGVQGALNTADRAPVLTRAANGIGEREHF